MIVRMPGGAEGRVNSDLVTLSDVTATMLALSGVEVPGYMDSRPLPNLGLRGDTIREAIVGATQGGWWIDDGRWRLCKYSTGDQFLFDRQHDPDEQHNLYADPACQQIRDRLDAELTQTVMAYTGEAHFDHRVYVSDLSQYPWFGREGWQRPFPRTVDDPQARRQD
jgi:arylsulfatase A-like enzyme